jgi:hypothetical protein
MGRIQTGLLRSAPRVNWKRNGDLARVRSEDSTLAVREPGKSTETAIRGNRSPGGTTGWIWRVATRSYQVGGRSDGLREGVPLRGIGVIGYPPGTGS